uniref:Uncharacterized protein n=1 Tax=Anguilla anguilla TaxID=7936 RepID=A0A0E9V104_ANGAN
MPKYHYATGYYRKTYCGRTCTGTSFHSAMWPCRGRFLQNATMHWLHEAKFYVISQKPSESFP